MMCPCGGDSTPGRATAHAGRVVLSFDRCKSCGRQGSYTCWEDGRIIGLGDGAVRCFNAGGYYGPGGLGAIPEEDAPDTPPGAEGPAPGNQGAARGEQLALL